MAFHGTLQYSLEFHGPPRKLHGISWHSMELHHYFMELRGTPWHSIELHGYSMAFHGTAWMLHGTPWHSLELHGYSMEVSWNSMDFHRFTWNSMDFHGFPWISMEVFHTGTLYERLKTKIRTTCLKGVYELNQGYPTTIFGKISVRKTI